MEHIEKMQAYTLYVSLLEVQSTTIKIKIDFNSNVNILRTNSDKGRQTKLNNHVTLSIPDKYGYKHRNHSKTSDTQREDEHKDRKPN